MGSKQQKFEYVRDDEGNKIGEGHELYKKESEKMRYFSYRGKDGKFYLMEPKKPRVFEYNGELWHHLDVPRQDLICENGTWNKTTFAVFGKAFRKEIGKVIRQSFTKDHLEVFIEKV